ncbi:hypothetical protein L6241_10000 [Janibacter sp. Y6]|uniref:hypothetical protein n=1 Tax=Janibacter sp. Y6 TaxID=2913552 RepID=UPI0034A1A289
MSTDDLKNNIGVNLVDNLKLTENIKQEVVMTTRDKIKVALHEMLPQYTSTEQLLAWAGLTIGLATALLTADFKDFLGISGETVAGAVGLGALLSLGVTSREVLRWFRRPNLDDVVDRIIQDSERQEA